MTTITSPCCFVCGQNVPTCVRTFTVLYHSVTEPICQQCFEMPTDEPQEARAWVPDPPSSEQPLA